MEPNMLFWKTPHSESEKVYIENLEGFSDKTGYFSGLELFNLSVGHCS